MFCNFAGCEVSGMLHHVSLYFRYLIYKKSFCLEYNCSSEPHIQVYSHSGFFLAAVSITPMQVHGIEFIPVLNMQHNSVQSLADSRAVRELRHSSLPAHRRKGSLD